MVNFEELYNSVEDDNKSKSSFIKKTLLVVVVACIFTSVGFAICEYLQTTTRPKNYTIITSESSETGKRTSIVLYNLPLISAPIRNINQTVKIGITVQLGNLKDVEVFESMLTKINDIIISHLMELEKSEIDNINGLYWLKKDLLYRINLLISPSRAENISFKSFEIIERPNQ